MTRPNPRTIQSLVVPDLDIDKLLYKNDDLSMAARLERRIVATLCAHLASKGWIPGSVEGGDDGPEKCHDAKSAMELVFNLDDCWLNFYKHGVSHGVRLIGGNGEDMVSDWTYTDGDVDGFDAAMNCLPEPI